MWRDWSSDVCSSDLIDDRLENVQAAFALGFAGIQMKDSVGTLVRSLATCNVTLR